MQKTHVAAMAWGIGLLLALVMGCGLWTGSDGVYDTKSIEVAVPAGGPGAKSLSVGTFDDVTSVTVVVSGEDKYGVPRDPLATVNLTKDTSGTWRGIIEDLPVGPKLTFEVSATDESDEEIFSGATVSILTGRTDAVTVALTPATYGTPILFPIITSISRPGEIVDGTTVTVAVGVKGTPRETLSFDVSAGGGAFSPASGAIGLSTSGTGTINLNFTAPVKAATYKHSITVTNGQGNAVTAVFTTVVVYELTDAGVEVLFYPSILSFSAQRVGDTIVWSAEVSDDGPEEELTYLWEFDGGLDFADPTANPAEMEDYNESTAGTMTFTATDEEDLATQVSFALVAGQFPDVLVIDGDAVLDAFFANRAPNRVLFNNGTGVFGDSGQSLAGYQSWDVDLGDLDSDGDLDAFISNFGPNKVWLNDGAGAYTDSGQSLAGNQSYAAALGDLDGDGDLDAFVANYGYSRVWLNNGSGVFSAGQSFPGSSSYDVALGDVDGDGDLDAVEGIYGYSQVWLNNGSGTFTTGYRFSGSSTRAVALGDLDRDGDLDVVEGNSGYSYIWLNNGAGAFSRVFTIPAGSDTWGLALGDLDDDGDLDIVESNRSHSRILLNIGGGRFSVGPSIGASDTQCAALGDVDQDGDLDMLVAFATSSASRLYLNNGSAGFTDSGQSLASGYPTMAIALGKLR